jgi:hypothetical protein
VWPFEPVGPDGREFAAYDPAVMDALSLRVSSSSSLSVLKAAEIIVPGADGLPPSHRFPGVPRPESRLVFRFVEGVRLHLLRKKGEFLLCSPAAPA